uniref:ISXO2-like transposase domain-containing protein n=1 Tax=Octopus bimaculoides TaxID=37653 RepID=A0A0L8G6F6_OCTBM|eukprot:XP_014783718.1 PREDICTED: uncharacterized protein LOC106878887 [Octopus bimaculoides]
MSMLRLSEICKDEISIISFFQEKGIIHQERRCNNGHCMNFSVGSQNRWRCRLRECRQEKGLRTDNWFANSRLSFHKAAFFIYCWAHDLASVNFCEHELEMKASCIVDWNNYLREVCAAHILSNPKVIGGPNMTVEIDESLFTKRKSCAGRQPPRQLVFGGICKETKECFMFTVPDRSATTLLPIIENNIRPGTTIISAEWSTYENIINSGRFQHLTVKNSLHFVDPTNTAHTQNSERLWKSAKEKNKRENGTHRALLDSYMCEFMWRQEIELKKLDPFDSILQHIADFWPPQ